MPILRLIERGTYEPPDIEIMTQALDEALRLAGVTDRGTATAEMIARRIVLQFAQGKRDPRQIAQQVVAN